MNIGSWKGKAIETNERKLLKKPKPSSDCKDEKVFVVRIALWRFQYKQKIMKEKFEESF